MIDCVIPTIIYRNDSKSYLSVGKLIGSTLEYTALMKQTDCLVGEVIEVVVTPPLTKPI